jgi:hypothetical protein
LAKKTKAKKAPPRPRQPRQDPLLVHAQAISELAAAIRQHADAIAARAGPAAPASVDTVTVSDVAVRPLSRGEILDGIKAVFNTHQDLKDDDEINALIPGGPGRLVAMWEDFDNYPLFRQRGLAIGPNDLRFVKYVKELIGVIAWGLKMALRR